VQLYLYTAQLIITKNKLVKFKKLTISYSVFVTTHHNYYSVATAQNPNNTVQICVKDILAYLSDNAFFTLIFLLQS